MQDTTTKPTIPCFLPFFLSSFTHSFYHSINQSIDGLDSDPVIYGKHCNTPYTTGDRPNYGFTNCHCLFRVHHGPRYTCIDSLHKCIHRNRRQNHHSRRPRRTNGPMREGVEKTMSVSMFCLLVVPSCACIRTIVTLPKMGRDELSATDNHIYPIYFDEYM